MTWTRIPLFVWSMVAQSILILLTVPVIAAALLLLLLDRQAGHDFFLPDGAGAPCSTSTCSGSSGTPRSTSSSCPRSGCISEIIPVFSRKPIFGYKAVAFSSLGIAFISMIVWAHHMFTVGLGDVAERLLHGRHATSSRSRPASRSSTGPRRSGAGTSTFPTPMLFALGMHRPLHHRRPLRDRRRATSRSTTRCTTATTSSRTSTTRSSAGWSSGSSPASTTGSRR